MSGWRVPRGLSATALLMLPLLGVGWQLGYHSFATYALFGAYIGLLGATSLRVTERFFPGEGFAPTLIRTSIVAFATVVAGGLLLGSAGVLTPLGFLAFSSGVFVLSRRLRARPARVPFPDLMFVPTWVGAVVITLVTFAIGYALTHAPFTLYDSVSYHLFFASRWLRDHRLSIIPTPFSDEAQAYAP